ncbi:MAG: peptide chain release factor-like protein [Nanoarchaeota archaeon]
MKQLVFSRSKKDFEVQHFRTGGPGGQAQNKRSNGTRIIDKETGLSSESREHRTQEQNTKSAFRKLCDKLVNYYCEKKDKNRFEAPNKTIRTYHEPDDRITDHVTGEKFSFRQTVGKGDISEIIESKIRKGKK